MKFSITSVWKVVATLVVIAAAIAAAVWYLRGDAGASVEDAYQTQPASIEPS